MLRFSRKRLVEVGYVYSHADELGALRLPSSSRRRSPGSRAKPRLRFDPDLALERLSGCSAGRTSEPAEAPSPRAPRRRRPPALGTNVELLPIRGR